MKTIVNKGRKPLRISLPGGKTLHLGLAAEGQVPEETLQRPAFRKLVEAGEVEVLGDADRSVVAEGNTTRIRQSAKGHPARTGISRKGDR